MNEKMDVAGPCSANEGQDLSANILIIDKPCEQCEAEYNFIIGK